MLHYKDNVIATAMDKNISTHSPITSVQEAGIHCSDACLNAAFCVQCQRWTSIQKFFLNSGLLDDNFFNRREFRSDRMCRAVCFLCFNLNLIVSKADILNYVWQEPKHRKVSISNVNVLIYDLRILFERQNVEIVNIRGLGYRLERKSEVFNR